MERGRRVCLLCRGIINPVTAVFLLMWVEREMRLLRVVAMMMVVVRVAFISGEIGPAITIIVRMRSSPYLALLRSSGRPLILVREVLRLASPVTRPLLLMWRNPPALVREAAVVTSPTVVVMRMVAATLGTNLSANRWRGLIGGPRCGVGLLYGS